MVRKLVVVLAAVTLALVGLPASADTGSISDATGDTHQAPKPKADYDIIRAGWGHTSDGKLRHWVVVAGTIGHPNTGHGVSPRLLINVPGQVYDNPTCDYFVSPIPPGVAPNTTDHWKWYVQGCSNTGAHVVGAASASRPTDHRIQLTFRKHAIGSPAHYGWAFDIPSDGDQPPHDRAPNAGYKRHNLS